MGLGGRSRVDGASLSFHGVVTGGEGPPVWPAGTIGGSDWFIWGCKRVSRGGAVFLEGLRERAMQLAKFQVIRRKVDAGLGGITTIDQGKGQPQAGREAALASSGLFSTSCWNFRRK